MLSVVDGNSPNSLRVLHVNESREHFYIYTSDDRESQDSVVLIRESFLCGRLINLDKHHSYSNHAA
jgi:hypothetical protein